MDKRQLEFDFLCKKKATDFEFASNGFVRRYEDRKSKVGQFVYRPENYPGPIALDATIEKTRKKQIW